MQKLHKAYKKIRLLHLVYTLNMGGLEKMVLELGKRVDNNRFESFVCCLTKEGTLSKDFDKAGVKVFYLYKKKNLDYSLPLRISKLLKEEKIDIVHTHDSSANLYGTIGAKLAGVKVNINTEHGGIYFESRRKRLVNGLLCSFVSHEICVSNSIKSDLIKMGVKDKKATVIPNGVDFTYFDAQISKGNSRKKYGLNESDFVITTVGRLSPEKHQIMLLKAADDILEKIPNAQILIVGDGRARKSLEDFAGDLKHSDKIRFLGESNEAPQVLGLSDCFVSTSLSESFGLTILEAMVAGIPVVATDVGGVPEIVKDHETGLLVDLDDTPGLSEAIYKIYHDRNLASTFTANAGKVARSMYSIDNMVKRHQDLYLTSVGNRFHHEYPTKAGRVLTFGIDNRALLDADGHSKRWNSRIGAHLDRLDIIVEMKHRSKILEKYIAPNVRIIPVYVPHPALYVYLAYKKALDEHKKNKYNLVTTEDPYRSGMAAALFKLKTHVPLSVEYPTDTFFNKSWLQQRPLINRIYQFLGKFVVKYSDSIRCRSQKNLEQLRGICGKGNKAHIEIITVPMKFFDFDEDLKKSIKIRNEITQDENGVVILYVGRLVPYKKVDELIKAFTEIRDEYKKTHLVIIGDGVDRKKLEQLAIKLGDKRILFTGYIPEDDVMGYIGACDIFVNPADNETYGRIFVEAMSAAKPVIAKYGVGAAEDKLLVHDFNSLLVKPDDISNLKNALIKLIEGSNLRKTLGKNSLVAVKQKFNYEDTVKRMKTFWVKTISNNKANYVNASSQQ